MGVLRGVCSARPHNPVPISRWGPSRKTNPPSTDGFSPWVKVLAKSLKTPFVQAAWIRPRSKQYLGIRAFKPLVFWKKNHTNKKFLKKPFFLRANVGQRHVNTACLFQSKNQRGRCHNNLFNAKNTPKTLCGRKCFPANHFSCTAHLCKKNTKVGCKKNIEAPQALR